MFENEEEKLREFRSELEDLKIPNRSAESGNS